MRRFLLAILALAVLSLPVFGFTSTVHAVDVINQPCNSANPADCGICTNPNATEKPAICKDNATSSKDNPILGPNGILARVVNILSLIAGIIAVFVIIIGGVKMIVSSGDSNSVASARRTVLFAVISLVIVGSAQAGVHFLLSKL